MAYITANFLADFRATGNRAAAAHGADGHITDANVAHYQIHSPDNAHHLTGTQAGTAYNNG